MDNELLPCPFCGRPAFLWGHRFGHKVSCMGDCVTMPSNFDTAFTTKDQAIEAWNRREYTDCVFRDNRNWRDNV